MALRELHGTTTFGPVAIPNAPANRQTVVEVRVPRMTSAAPTVFADPTAWIQVDIEASFDGGTTWVAAGGFGCWGGVHRRLDGTEAEFSELSVSYPAGQNRLVRGTLTVSKPQLGDVVLSTRTVVTT